MLKAKHIIANDEANCNFFTLSSLWYGYDSKTPYKFPKFPSHQQSHVILLWRNDRMTVWFQEHEILASARDTLKKISQGDKYRQQIFRPFMKAFRQAEKLFLIISQSNLKKVSDDQLLSWIEQTHLNNATTTWYDGIGVMSDILGVLSGQIEKIISRRKNLKRSSAEYLKVLMGQNLYSPSQQIKYQLQNSSNKLSDKIKQIIDQYPWLNYDYQGPKVTAKQLKEIAKSDSFESLAAVKKRQQFYRRELKLSRAEYCYCRYAQHFSYQKILRMDSRSMMDYCFDSIAQELVRRTGYSLTDFRYCNPQDIQAIVKRKKSAPTKVELKKRRQYSLCYFKNKKVQWLFDKKKIEKYINDHQKVEIIDETIKELTGSIAYMGQSTGLVRRLETLTDMKKMKKGDILVAYNTVPEMVPVMKIAAAIISEQGGITCHAAIVSRELKVPCLVGVKNAMKLLKDGDRVEVDATVGTIKRL